MPDQLIVTLGELPHDEEGIQNDDFTENLRPNELRASVKDMLLRAVEHFGGQENICGQLPNRVHESSIELYPAGPGRLFARWTFEHGPQAESYTTGTTESLLAQGQNGTMAYFEPLLDFLRSLPNDHNPSNLGRWPILWLGNADNPQRVRITLPESDNTEKLIDDLHTIGLRCAALLSQGPSAVEHGDFLYDEKGLPK